MSLAAPMSEEIHFLFDLDGTILNVELLPFIGATLGVEGELAELTRLTMDGVIPFEASFRHRVEILQNAPISRIREIIMSAPRNQEIVEFIRCHRDRCHIVTGNCDAWVDPVARELGVSLDASTAIVDGDRLWGVARIVDKRAVARRYHGASVAIGDGHNDLGMFQECRHSVAYGGVHPPASSLLAAATHVTFDPRTLCRLLHQLS